MKRYVIAAAIFIVGAPLFLIVGISALQVGVAQHERNEEAVIQERLKIIAAQRQAKEWIRQGKPKPFGARNPRLSASRQAATPEDLDALDAMKEGDWQEAARILHEQDRKPEAWLVELRKKMGATNPESMIGPTWEEIQMWSKENEE